jgi:SSS family solute:Na+ symporter
MELLILVNLGALNVLDLAVIFAYLVGLSGIGIYFSKKQSSREEYFLGNRQMPWLIVGVSLVATLISAMTYLSVPGEAIKFGIGFFSSLLAYPLVIPVVNRVVIPVIVRLPIRSVYEYLEKRYGGGIRSLGAAAFVSSRLLWIGLIIYTTSFAVSTMTGANIKSIILVIGLVTTLYTTLGGMRAVIWTDFSQFLLMLGSIVLVPIYIAFRTGTGPSFWWHVFSEAGRTEVRLFSFDPAVRVTVLGMLIEIFFWNICTHSSDQLAVQRYLSTPSLTAARRTLWVSTICTVTLISLLVFCGIALFAFDYLQSGLPLQVFQREIASHADQALPRFIATELPHGISGLLLAAVLAAAMSSLSSGINSISNVVVTDGLERLGAWKRYRHTGGVSLERTVAIIAGLIGLGVALAVAASLVSMKWNLVEMMERLNHLFVGPLGVLVFAGILFPRVGKEAALVGFMFALLTSIYVSFGREILPWGFEFSFMWVVPASFTLGMAFAWVSSLALPQPASSQVDGLTLRRKGDAYHIHNLQESD